MITATATGSGNAPGWCRSEYFEGTAIQRSSRRPKPLRSFARLAKSLPKEADIAKSIPGVTTYAELEALAPSEFLARWLEADDPRYEIVKRLRAHGEAVPDCDARSLLPRAECTKVI